MKCGNFQLLASLRWERWGVDWRICRVSRFIHFPCFLGWIVTTPIKRWFIFAAKIRPLRRTFDPPSTLTEKLRNISALVVTKRRPLSNQANASWPYANDLESRRLFSIFERFQGLLCLVMYHASRKAVARFAPIAFLYKIAKRVPIAVSLSECFVSNSL